MQSEQTKYEFNEEKIKDIQEMNAYGVLCEGIKILKNGEYSDEEQQSMLSKLLEIRKIALAPYSSCKAAFYGYANSVITSLRETLEDYVVTPEESENPINRVKALNEMLSSPLSDPSEKRRKALEYLKQVIETAKTEGHFDLSGYGQPQQIYMFHDISHFVPKDDLVRLVDLFVDCLDLSGIEETYRNADACSVDAATMLKLIVYGRAKNIFTTRAMEDACKENVKMMFLLNGKSAPDYSTFARFTSQHYAPVATKILSLFTQVLQAIGEINEDVVFIDGTKIESVAGRYTFVWKKCVYKYNEKLAETAVKRAREIEDEYHFGVVRQSEEGDYKISIPVLNKLLKCLRDKAIRDKVEMVHGSGSRKSVLQHHIEDLDAIVSKLKEYEEKLRTCGERNSYSKTDPDATFMHMKDDHMRNGQLKPAYNLQHAVNSGYVVYVSSSSHPNDQFTLKELVEDMRKDLPLTIKAITADAGYFSEENLQFLEKSGIMSYIKPMDYEKSKTRAYKKDIGLARNMAYDAETDTYRCHEGKTLTKEREYTQKTRSGYERHISVYTCASCSECKHKTECIHGNHCKTPMDKRNKKLYVSHEGVRLENDNLERIQSETGKQYRLNRSIQAEGSFAQLKSNHPYIRYRHRGMQKTEADSILNAMGLNMVHLRNRIQAKKTGDHLHDLKTTDQAA